MFRRARHLRVAKRDGKNSQTVERNELSVSQSSRLKTTTNRRTEGAFRLFSGNFGRSTGRMERSAEIGDSAIQLFSTAASLLNEHYL